MFNTSKFAAYKNVLLLGLTSLLNDISSEMVLPVLPLLIERLGGTGIAIGIIGGLRESFADLLKVVFGYWSDRVGKRKEFVYAGYIATMIFKFFLYLATSWYQILIFIGLERVGKGLRTAPRDAIIVQSMPDRIGTGFGIHRACDTLGALIGSALAAYVVWKWHVGLSTIIFWAFIVALFAVIPLYWVKDEPAQQPLVSTPNQVPAEKPSLFVFTPQLIMFIAIASLFSLANVSYMFCMLHVSEAFAIAYPVAIPMLLYAVFNTVYTIMAIPFGYLSDIIGRGKVIIAGYGLFAATMFGFAMARSFSSFLICFILYGLALAAVKVSNKAYVADLSLPAFRSTALGTFEATTGITTLLAGVFIGVMWEYFNHATVFAYAGSVAVIAMILMFFVNHRQVRA